MNTSVTLKFLHWKSPHKPPEEKVISFFNDDHFTTNSVTSLKLPMNYETFNYHIQSYITSGEAILISQHQSND